MIQAGVKVILIEWRCRVCGRLIAKYTANSTGEYHHKCRNCNVENILTLPKVA